MGGELTTAEIALPIDRAPDWSAAELALDFLELRTFYPGDGLLDDMFTEAEREVGEELEAHDPRAVYWALCGLHGYLTSGFETVRTTIETLDPREVVVIEARGLRIYCSGGTAGGDPPTETLHPLFELAEANILQQAGFTHVARTGSDDPVGRQLGFVDEEDTIRVRATEALRMAELAVERGLMEGGGAPGLSGVADELEIRFREAREVSEEGPSRFLGALFALATAGLRGTAQVRARRDAVPLNTALRAQAVETLEVLDPLGESAREEPQAPADRLEAIRPQLEEALDRLDVLVDEAGEKEYANALREHHGTVEDAVIAQLVGLVLADVLLAIGHLTPDGLDVLKPARSEALDGAAPAGSPTPMGGPGLAAHLAWTVIERGRSPDWRAAEAVLAELEHPDRLRGAEGSQGRRVRAGETGESPLREAARRQLTEDLSTIQEVMARSAGGYERYVTDTDIGDLTLWLMADDARSAEYRGATVRLAQAGVLWAAGFEPVPVIDRV
jgi:hypothetical protein